MFMLVSGNVACTLSGGSATSIPAMVPYLVTLIINAIKIGVPVLLVIFGMMDLGKAVMAQKEDEIKKGQQTFIKRLIAAVIVFLVTFIVQLVVGLVAPKDSDNANIWDCFDCMINYSETNASCNYTAD